MASDNVGTLVGKIYDLVKDLELEDVSRVFGAVSALFSGKLPQITTTPIGGQIQTVNPPPTAASNSSDPAAYFASKDPKSKQEELAVAARFRETIRGETKHTKKDFEAIFGEARRNFDGPNFAFDMRNAKKAGFFVKGGAKSHSHSLSYFGQNFVDALPDRSKAQATKAKSKKKRNKAKTAK